MYISNNFIKIFRKNDLNKQYRHSFCNNILGVVPIAVRETLYF